MAEVALDGGVVVFRSPKVDAAAREGEAKLREHLGEAAEEFLASKRARDGSEHHITLFNPGEVRVLVEKVAEVLREKDPSLSKGKSRDEAKHSLRRLLAADLDEDWRAEGLGRAVAGPDEAYFVVIAWPRVGKLRAEFGLPPDKDLHITVGFKGKDVHGVPKGRGTLVASHFLLSATRGSNMDRTASLVARRFKHVMAAPKKKESEKAEVPSGPMKVKWDDLDKHLGRAEQNLKDLATAAKNKDVKECFHALYGLLVAASWMAHEMGIKKATDLAHDAGGEVLRAGHDL